jgi:hypothetical protein
VKVAILGCGPAGLLAAHAASQMDWEFDIYSSGGKSSLYGAQYLHQPIPGIPDLRQTTVTHKFIGDITGYRSKVYGIVWDGVVSPEMYFGKQPAWDIRQAYDWLWDTYGGQVKDTDISGYALLGAIDSWKPMWHLKTQYDLIISTIPRRVLCVNPDHKFNVAEIYCIGDAPDLGVSIPVQMEDDTLVCSGDPVTSWYRACRVFGVGTVEWGTSKKRPPIEGVVKVQKPVSTDCDCWPEISYQGRYGKWEKGVLSHHAYQGAAIVMRDWNLKVAN